MQHWSNFILAVLYSFVYSDNLVLFVNPLNLKTLVNKCNEFAQIYPLKAYLKFILISETNKTLKCIYHIELLSLGLYESVIWKASQSWPLAEKFTWIVLLMYLSLLIKSNWFSSTLRNFWPPQGLKNKVIKRPAMNLVFFD